MKKKVYVCFDYDQDKHYKYLMNAWSANPNFEFSFNDKSPNEIQSDDISVIKTCLTKKINEADITIVLAGKDANKMHKDHRQIGYINWQNFEIARSIDNHNKLILVQLPNYSGEPIEAFRHVSQWVDSFNEAKIMNALKNVD